MSLPVPRATVLAALLVIGAACAGPSQSPTPSPASTPAPTATPTFAPTATPTFAPTATPTSAPTAKPAPSPTGSSVVVTFTVIDQQYRILLTDPNDIAIARRLLAGEEAPRIPNGVIVRGDTGVNVGWSWSIDPESVEFADMTTEVCDGLPSYVEDRTLSGDRYCPWAAVVTAIEPAP